MAVKSATKKKLVEQGVAPEHAHLLATDRNMADLKALSIDQIAEILSLSVDDEAVKRASQLTQASGRRSRSGTSRRVSISTKAIEDDTIPLGSTRFNVLNHELVPHQELVPHEDEASELEPWGLMAVDAEGNSRLRKELLPKVLISDPAVQAVKEMAEAASEHPMSAGWLRDRVLKVIRRSPTAGTSIAYRLIVEGN